MTANNSKLAAVWLAVLGGVSIIAYVIIHVLSLTFVYGAGHRERPILEVLGLFTIAGVCYLAALFLVMRAFRTGYGSGETSGNEAVVLTIVLLFAAAFRLVMIPANAIQEVDYYRYLWDGRVLAAGYTPFRFSPKQIDEWLKATTDREERHALWQLAYQSKAVRTIFRRVHHRHVPTVYPPMAQVVFGLSALLTPADADLGRHIMTLKLLLLFFDAGVIALLILILRMLRWPLAWCLSYAWCPLVLKEISNSAHLDSIAVFFSTLSVYLLMLIWQRLRGVHSRGRDEGLPQAGRNSLARPLALGCLAAACLGFGVLAKSYPIILLPVVIGFLLVSLRSYVVIPVAAFALSVFLGYAPFLHSDNADARPNSSGVAQTKATTPKEPEHTPLTGLKTFLTQWEMNDFLFMLVHENLRRPSANADRFFVLTPRSLRQAIDEAGRKLDSWGAPLVGRNPSFFLTQCIMGLAVLGISVIWAVQVYRRRHPQTLLRGVFLVLVWAWLLNPAQNPWYLTWCLPFMIFDGRKSWFLLPVLAMTYYMRFWMEYLHWPDRPKVDQLVEIFDYGIVWLEYAPFLVLLALESIHLRKSSAADVHQNDQTKNVLPGKAKSTPSGAGQRRGKKPSGKSQGVKRSRRLAS